MQKSAKQINGKRLRLLVWCFVPQDRSFISYKFRNRRWQRSVCHEWDRSSMELMTRRILFNNWKVSYVNLVLSWRHYARAEAKQNFCCKNNQQPITRSIFLSGFISDFFFNWDAQRDVPHFAHTQAQCEATMRLWKLRWFWTNLLQGMQWTWTMIATTTFLKHRKTLNRESWMNHSVTQVGKELLAARVAFFLQVFRFEKSLKVCC